MPRAEPPINNKLLTLSRKTTTTTENRKKAIGMYFTSVRKLSRAFLSVLLHWQGNSITYIPLLFGDGKCVADLYPCVMCTVKSLLRDRFWSTETVYRRQKRAASVVIWGDRGIDLYIHSTSDATPGTEPHISIEIDVPQNTGRSRNFCLLKQCNDSIKSHGDLSLEVTGEQFNSNRVCYVWMIVSVSCVKPSQCVP